MFTITTDTKSYLLEKFQYSVVLGIPSLYLQFQITEGDRVYSYGFNLDSTEIQAVADILSTNFGDYIKEKLIALNA